MTALYVDRAAILFDGVIYSVPRPGRHHDVIRFMAEKFGPDWYLHDDEQGFVLSDGSFADRARAWEHAVLAGQLLPRAPTDARGGRLYSEDIF